MTCGSVDDGKSTLIGRLLFDASLLTDQQKDELKTLSAKSHNVGRDGLDYSLLLDGLEAEREQGITIDVAYRYFETPHRKFIVGDAPGHEQYLGNMATAASTAEAALLVVDARKGLLAQTRRHACIAAVFGIGHVILAVNKMDLVAFDRAIFDKIAAEFAQLLSALKVKSFDCIPISAREGDNIVRPSDRMDWYRGPTLLRLLEGVRPQASQTPRPFRFPVQWVNRANSDFRGYAGTIAAGAAGVGDAVTILPAGTTSTIERIVTVDGDLATAHQGQAVTLTLATDLSVVRGDIISSSNERAQIADQFAVMIIWLADEPMIHERNYILRFGPRSVVGQITSLRHRLNVETFEQVSAKNLARNEIAICHLATNEPIPFDTYDVIKETGSFVVIDRHTNATLGCGIIQFALRRAENLHWQKTKVDKDYRAHLKGQRPSVLWFTGLSGSGKSTIANLVEAKLASLGKHTYLLDGDNVRHGLSRDLGFTVEDRVENIRRIGECAKLFVDAGLIVIVAFISPFRDDRTMARHMLNKDEFIECFVNTSLEECERRDPKGLYRKARAGALPNFTGIDSPYEVPLDAEIELATAEEDADALAERVIAFLRARNYLL
jgi:bifunctional enzyme CysN/CysC